MISARPFRDIDPLGTNNALHNALIEMDNALALQLARTLPAEEINKPSLGNTPLLLALKVGSDAVAKALLTRTDVNFRKRDNRGVTAIHYACALRCNELILMLLEKYREYVKQSENLDIVTDEELREFLNLPGYLIWPLNKNDSLYDARLLRRKSDNSKATRTLNDTYSGELEAGRIRSDVRFYEDNIVDNARLVAWCVPELTDVLFFHMRSHCLNQELLAEGEFKNYCSSSIEFYRDLMSGLEVFVRNRNSQSLDPRILALLMLTPELEKTSTSTARL